MLADEIELKIDDNDLDPTVRTLRLRYVELLRRVAKAARSIEWVDSSDYAPGDEVTDLKAALGDPP